MKAEISPLLEAVLADSVEFQAESLVRTLGQVRRRKRVQRARQGALALAVGLPFAVWRWRSPVTSETPIATAAPVPVVARLAPSAGMIVTTTSGVTRVVESVPGGAGLIQTAIDGRPVPELTDDELLQLVAGRAAALVRMGGEAQLVVADNARPSPAQATP